MLSPREEGILPEENPVMISIPIAPRVRRVPIRKRARAWILFKVRKTILAVKRIDLTGPEWERRREAVQSLSAGLAINAVLAILLMFVLIVDQSEEVDHAIQVAFAEDPNDEKLSQSSDGAASAKSRVKSKAPPPIKVATTTAKRAVFVEPSIDVSLNVSPGYDPAAMSLDFGASMTAADFKAAKNGYAIGENGKGKKGKGTSGIGFAEMGGFFADHGLGDGSKMVLFIDTSGSMDAVSREVNNYVSARFKKSVTSHITGCAINSLNCPVLTAFRNQKFRKERDQYFFICDLHDSVTESGIRELRRILTDTEHPKTLHVISFGYSPTLSLLNLVQDTGGTITVTSK